MNKKLSTDLKLQFDNALHGEVEVSGCSSVLDCPRGELEFLVDTDGGQASPVLMLSVSACGLDEVSDSDGVHDVYVSLILEPDQARQLADFIRVCLGRLPEPKKRPRVRWEQSAKGSER